MARASRIVSLLAFVLILAVGVSLSATASASSNSATRTTNKTTAKSKTATSKKAANTMKESHAKKMSHVLASAEDLSGTVSAVNSSGREVTLVGSNGVPYDFELTRRTRVELSNQKIGMDELASESHKQATVHFVPTSRGNLAERVQITS
jgi:hypothetical protein